MKKITGAQQAQTKNWPYENPHPYVSQATSLMTDEIKQLVHDAITIGVENNRLLRWLVVHKQSEFRDEIMILEQLPDISDIIKK